MRKVGVFGGSFDPVHFGHTRLAHYVLRNATLDEVWLMVSPHNPLKDNRPVASDSQRLDMVRLAVKDLPGLMASDFEFSLPVPSYSWHTLSRLKETFPNSCFSLIIGGDNWADFNRWQNHDLILREFDVIVYPRPSQPMPCVPQGVTILNGAPQMEVSSTEIRNLIANGGLDSQDRLRNLIDPKVLDYIVANGLYGR